MDISEHMNRIKKLDSKPYIQIPNDLLKKVTRTVREYDKESYAHYAYSYLVLHGFLYKYTNYIDINSGDYLNVQDIKSILKYNPLNQRVDAISRREDGILEKEGFIRSTRDIPIAHCYVDSNNNNYRKREIITASDIDGDLREHIYEHILRTPNYFVSIPNYMTDSERVSGTLNNYQNTFRLSYHEFEYFIFNDDYSLRDFFLYCLLRGARRGHELPGISLDTFKRQTGLSKNTVTKITNKLESDDIISIKSVNSSYRVRNPNKYGVKKSFIDSLVT